MANQAYEPLFGGNLLSVHDWSRQLGVPPVPAWKPDSIRANAVARTCAHMPATGEVSQDRAFAGAIGAASLTCLPATPAEEEAPIPGHTLPADSRRLAQ